MIDALYPEGGSSVEATAGDALLTNCPEGHPMWQAETHEIVDRLSVEAILTSNQLAEKL